VLVCRCVGRRSGMRCGRRAALCVLVVVVVVVMRDVYEIVKAAF